MPRRILAFQCAEKILQPASVPNVDLYHSGGTCVRTRKGHIYIFQIILAHNDSSLQLTSVPSMIPMSLQVGNHIGPKYRLVSPITDWASKPADLRLLDTFRIYIIRFPVLAHGQRSRVCMCPMHAVCSLEFPDHCTFALAVLGECDTCVFYLIQTSSSCKIRACLGLRTVCLFGRRSRWFERARSSPKSIPSDGQNANIH